MPPSRRLAALSSLAVLASVALAATPAAADDDDAHLLGDWKGARPWLAAHGITPTLTWTGEVLGNPTGGLKQGAVYDGLAELALDFDLATILAWPGATLHASGYWIQGHGLSECCVGNLLTVSSIEAPAGWRFDELYLEQSLAGGAVSVRVGDIAADTEFWLSDTAGLFVNSTFGWPGIDALDMPGGGPAYPTPTPGVRLRWNPDPAFALQAGVFNGNPLGDGEDANGLAFALGDGVFAIVEAAVSYAPEGGLAGTWKLGAWMNSEDFDNLSIARNGRSLASPAARGGPRQEAGDFALYAIVDHGLWNEPGGDGQGLAGFLRVSIAPQQDRNPVTVYADGGLAYTGLLPGRDGDVLGIAFAYAGMSPDLASLDRRQNAVSGIDGPVVDFEAVAEVTYQAAITPALSLQPFAQYVIHPGGNVANPDGRDPTEPLADAAVFGLRANVTF